MLLESWIPGIGRALHAAVEMLIVKPVQGIAQIIAGIFQAGPALLRASAQAAVEAVKSRLTASALASVREGADKVLAGGRLLAAPAAALVVIWICTNPSVIYILFASWFLALAGGLACG